MFTDESKMLRIALIIISLVAFNLISVKSTAQDSLKIERMDGYFYFHPNAGASQYFGDINIDNYWNRDPQIAIGAILGYQLSPVFGFRGQFLKTDLYSKRPDQNLVLYSKLWDASLNLTINVNEIFAKYSETRLLNIYLFSGAGITSYKSTLENIEPREVIYLHKEEQHELFVPIGGGISFRLSPYLALNLEYGDHITFKSDGIDFTSEGKKNDHYSYASVGIQVKYKGKDTDNDGVNDRKDACPDIAGKVKFAGCPDVDDDGIADKDDACPDLAGLSEFKGCPDTDGDGINDMADNCPFVAGTKELKGCPDKDNDGITDKEDKCPELAGKQENAGCPDSDGDGIVDYLDACPHLKGLANFNGCPDSDGDGISDNQDSCIYEPGKRELNGCPDKDNDGIADKYDNCPNNEGKKELAGCPDRDGDGVADKDDICPENKGLAIFKGCPDTDGDGIPDYKDRCPKVAGVIANFGCPVMPVKTETQVKTEVPVKAQIPVKTVTPVKTTEPVKTAIPEIPVIAKKTETSIQRRVTFNSGSSEVFPSFKNMLSLDEIVKFISENPEAKISVAGFTDNAEQNDLQLSEKRADYVIDYLKKKGVKSLKVKKSFFGKSKPIANNNTAEGRNLNRRVEISVIK